MITFGLDNEYKKSPALSVCVCAGMPAVGQMAAPESKDPGAAKGPFVDGPRTVPRRGHPRRLEKVGEKVVGSAAAVYIIAYVN